MRETKDSGVDWIGEVPVNWEIVPIKADVSINWTWLRPHNAW